LENLTDDEENNKRERTGSKKGEKVERGKK
jgi:hypothetical protein